MRPQTRPTPGAMPSPPTSNGERLSRPGGGPPGALNWSIWVLTAHPVLLALCAVAAFGRAVQVGWAQQHSALVYWALETVVEPARLLVFVGAVGSGKVRRGAWVLREWWRQRRTRRRSQGAPPERTGKGTPLKKLWWPLSLEVVKFAVLVAAVNIAIAFAAGSHFTKTRVSDLLRDSPTAPIAVELFLKNLTVIPLMLCFYVGGYRYWQRLRAGLEI